MRLLHTSDWHLGRRFFGRSLVSDQEYVLDQMINLVRDLNPEVMVVAGDVFHQRRPSEEALALFHDTLGRLLGLGTTLVFLGGPTDDFGSLHLDARWVREAGVYLVDDATRVLSPFTFRGLRDDFDVKMWCLSYPKPGDATQGEQHPALAGHSLVEKVVQRLDPSQVNIFAGYVWTQDCGKQPELGTLIQPGGRPLEKRVLEFFEVSALGGRHQPLVLSGMNACYSGSLLCYEPDDSANSRSVTLYDIAAKNQVYIDHYPLRPRRNLRVLTGSWEELVEKGRQMRSDDLIVLRSEERNLTPEQRADLRVLSPNIVSVELPSPFEAVEQGESEQDLSPLLRSFQEFFREQAGQELTEEQLEILIDVEKKL